MGKKKQWNSGISFDEDEDDSQKSKGKRGAPSPSGAKGGTPSKQQRKADDSAVRSGGKEAGVEFHLGGMGRKGGARRESGGSAAGGGGGGGGGGGRGGNNSRLSLGNSPAVSEKKSKKGKGGKETPAKSRGADDNRELPAIQPLVVRALRSTLPRIVPWRDWTEWDTVGKALFSEERGKRMWAVQRIRVWQSR
jgi:hypothetical protein